MRRALALLALLVLAGCSGKDEELRPYACAVPMYGRR